MSWIGSRSASSRSHRRLRTARCVLRDGDQSLLVVHRGRGRELNPVWGLPGGHIERGERPEHAIYRELEEELGLHISTPEFVADYEFRGAMHRVFVADLPEPIRWFDRTELVRIGWHDVDAVQQLESSGRLHAGYEGRAVSRSFARPPSGIRAAG